MFASWEEGEDLECLRGGLARKERYDTEPKISSRENGAQGKSGLAYSPVPLAQAQTSLISVLWECLGNAHPRATKVRWRFGCVYCSFSHSPKSKSKKWMLEKRKSTEVEFMIVDRVIMNEKFSFNLS
jgi:hypothetical protein